MSLPRVDIFISKFLNVYHEKSSKDFNNLLVACILKAFFSKMGGEQIQSIQSMFTIFTFNCTQHHGKVLNLYWEIFLY